MSRVSSLLVAAAVCALAASPAMVRPAEAHGLHLGWYHHHHDGDPGKGYAVPAPVAGIGLPVAIAAAGYFWMTRRRRNSGRRAGREQ